MADRFYGDSELRWTTLHPEHWTTCEVAGWVDSVITANGIKGYDSHVIHQAFESVTGPQLIGMTKDDFTSLLGIRDGEFMYRCFRTVYSSVPTVQTEDLLRSLTPIPEKADSEDSPEPETDADHAKTATSASGGISSSVTQTTGGTSNQSKHTSS